ncbi:peptide-methionine (S)-S-oxide reductase [Nitrosomonas cryotolerans]|uniref:Peptide methionine sulfoxide reductase MsrA n=1 Tax=Nitrosomonas cryotolerans ATCC 49181 TaxID=1131553 RepID=A0A1N6JBU3_9PROT|nr:peptide-methionine (S)-S-oxide reductase MsrA [Nitrosomonas cryotolerans]SFP48423.1 peptide-methionine (S)-S-oxide reductase [Nitrosomonas cryotolerans]SIO41750.1 peptide-methionine (S)-S-oxide reductase [Nitrosomonas cryotolerans ATCC 49181]
MVEKIIFGAGCFWGVEATFRRLKGVSNIICGYSGGHTKYPTYPDVCTGRTGHVEVVQVTYESLEISCEELLDVFWNCHNPTTQDRQGADVGTQYRSVIFFLTPEQETAAKLSLQILQQDKRYQEPIVTKILPAVTFYPAEEYHQRYLEKQGLR